MSIADLFARQLVADQALIGISVLVRADQAVDGDIIGVIVAPALVTGSVCIPVTGLDPVDDEDKLAAWEITE